MPTHCGVSVDARIALGDGDASPHHAGGATTPSPVSPVRTCVRLSVSHRASARFRVSDLPMPSSPGAIQISTDTPQYVGTVPLLRWHVGA